MIRIAVLDDYQNAALGLADWNSLGPDVQIDVFTKNLALPDEAAKALAPYDVICLMRERMVLDRTLIAALPNLKFVSVTGARTASIDRDALEERKIFVSNTIGGESQYATPEMAWGLILSCLRHIPREVATVAKDGWQQTIGTILHGKTLGLLGLGKLGSAMVPVARAFGMKVIAWSQNLTSDKAEAVGATLASKDELLAQSDVLSIHLVLSGRTRGLIGAAELAQMKNSAVLINTSRGPIVDEAALIAALRNKTIAGAGLDVFDVEPLPAGHPLRGLPNVVATPHLGYVTTGSYQDFYRYTVENIAAWRAGSPVRPLPR